MLRTVRTRLLLAMMIATVGSSWFLAACGNNHTSTEATGSTTSAQSAVLETAPNPLGDDRPLQTVNDFRKAAETVGETLEPCSHSDVYLMCISMTQVAEPMLAAISQAAASMGWTDVVSTVTDIQNASLLYKGCGTTLHGQRAETPSFSELSECMNATAILGSANVRIGIAITKDS
jgi:hypothetical protein